MLKLILTDGQHLYVHEAENAQGAWVGPPVPAVVLEAIDCERGLIVSHNEAAPPTEHFRARVNKRAWIVLVG